MTSEVIAHVEATLRGANISLSWLTFTCVLSSGMVLGRGG